MEQPQCRGAVGGVQAVLLAGHVIVNVVASAFFAAVEPVSLSHNCIHSDEVTTIDLGSGREQVGVTQGRPELNPAGTSAGTRLWKLTKPYSSNWLGLEAEVGIDPSSPQFCSKIANVCRLFKRIRHYSRTSLELFIRCPFWCPRNTRVV